ncbi:MAG TPA: N-acetylglucosamine kinase [Puia sp.]|jgi:N-acetylglucosamine kinase-like BadF-type ATPase|nr:N-acetylglucosamine kinase [Puia sp.]
MNILIADCGSTKSEWCLLHGGKKKKMETQGISPYFLDSDQIGQIIRTELYPALSNYRVDRIFYYGTGCAAPANKRIVRRAIRQFFLKAEIYVDHDLMGAALALCGKSKAIACNLGTGSFSCYFDGRKIVKSIPGLGFVLGDEGSGAYMGKKVLQYYLYETFDAALRSRFDAKYATNRSEILENVYKNPLPNRYLASFAIFLAENRGHYMIENIIEDGLNDFFSTHICRYNESRKLPIHFVGGIAWGFQDIIKELALSYKLDMGRILQKPMTGLIEYHS